MANVSALLSSKPRLTDADLKQFIGEIENQPKAAQQAELNALLTAGEARLPDGGASTIRDFLFRMNLDEMVPDASTVKRHQPATITESRFEYRKAMDGGSVESNLHLQLEGKAKPGDTLEIYNFSRADLRKIGTVTAAEDGHFKFDSSTANNPYFTDGDKIGVAVSGGTGGRSEMSVQSPRTVEIRCWQNGETKSVDVHLDRSAPIFEQSRVQRQDVLPTPKDKARHMLITGQARATEPFAAIEVVVDNVAHKTVAAADGSFFIDVKGVKPDQSYQLRAIDANNMVSVANYASTALRFDSDSLSNASQNVPYDRFVDGKADDKGPFLRFKADNVAEPYAQVTIQNHSTGEKTTVNADDKGNIDFELGHVHAGDALGFYAADLAGNVANNLLENWCVPARGVAHARVTELVCAETMPAAQVDELIGLIKDNPNSVHRDVVGTFLETRAESVLQTPALLTKLKTAFDKAFSGANDVRTQPNNTLPKEPIVINANIIKPRVMDGGSAPNRDPLEIAGTAEPFSTVEVRNASQPNAPIIGRVQADKDGNFKFVSRDETKFLHGDQLYLRSVDQGGATSTDTLTHTCAYELQVWTQQNRSELVKLPQTTDTRPPFVDNSKVKSGFEPIKANGREQVFTVDGAARSAEPGSILRVTNTRGDIYETQAAKDGSFKLNVGTVTPGETLSVIALDAAGRTVTQNYATPALRFDSDTLMASTQGVPYQKYDEDKAHKWGPFLQFTAPASVDPHAVVTIKNNTSGETFTARANEKGDLDYELRRVHAGDSLSIEVSDPAGNLAPNQIENYVVPGVPRVSAKLQEMQDQEQYLGEHVDALLQIVQNEPTAANRAVVEAIVKNTDAFADADDLKRLSDGIKAVYSDANDVRIYDRNPAPKMPIIIGAEIIKPRVMDSGSTPVRDPIEVRGKAEPYATVEFRNASMPNAPLIGRIQADKNGVFKFISSDESKFNHGDMVLARTVDQGGEASGERLTTTRAYELRVWHNPPRTEKVRLERSTDARPPFIDMSKVAHTLKPIAADGRDQVYNIVGQARSAEPMSVVRVSTQKGEVFETRVNKDGSFKLDVGAFTPGETLTLTAFDVNGRTVNSNIATQPLKFEPQTLVNSSEGVPYRRANVEQNADAGPFLRFGGDKMLDPHSIIEIKNNSTGKVTTAQADINGKLDVELNAVHSGDSLSFVVRDPAGNVAPESLVNYVVPGSPRCAQQLLDLTCQRTILPEHADQIIDLLKSQPTAAHRGLVDTWLGDSHSSFQSAADKDRIKTAMAGIFVGVHDVVSDASNPAPKEPIVIDARVIKPRVMDQGSVANRDPLEVSGQAEPFSTIEIRNASQPNAPVIGRTQVDANGEFKFISTNEALFGHGDQLVVRAIDQGNASSTEVVSGTCAYELRVWNRENRTEMVKLDVNADARPPFLDMSKVKSNQQIATRASAKTYTTIEGAARSSEPNSIVRVTTSKGVSETKVGKDGSFKLDVSGYVPGETLQVNVFDVNGRSVQQNIPTQALTFNPAVLLRDVEGPPYQKLSHGEPVAGGPFMHIKADNVAFANAVLKATNHATGKTQTVVADANGGFDFELSGVHAHDLITFKVEDAAGNPAPEVLQAWQVPVETVGKIDPVIAALTRQRPMTDAHVDELVRALEAQPTPQHRVACERLLHEHADWFLGDCAPTLQKAIERIFARDPELVPDISNPKPRMPIVLSSEIIKPRVMDSGAAPRDPLQITGIAEPLTTVEIYNGSVAGRPLIGSVKVGEDGRFKFESTDESKFLHGDQIVLASKDAGGEQSAKVVSRATAFELRIWNSSGRREKVELGANADTRDPFIKLDLLKTERASGTAADQNNVVITGASGATEPYGLVEVKIGTETYKTEADIDGAFRLPIVGLEVGTAVQLVARDPNGRSKAADFTPVVA